MVNVEKTTSLEQEQRATGKRPEIAVYSDTEKEKYIEAAKAEAAAENEARQNEAEQLDMAEELDKLIAEANPTINDEVKPKGVESTNYEGVIYEFTPADKAVMGAIEVSNDGHFDTKEDLTKQKAEKNPALPDTRLQKLAQGLQSLPGVNTITMMLVKRKKAA